MGSRIGRCCCALAIPWFLSWRWHSTELCWKRSNYKLPPAIRAKPSTPCGISPIDDQHQNLAWGPGFSSSPIMNPVLLDVEILLIYLAWVFDAALTAIYGLHEVVSAISLKDPVIQWRAANPFILNHPSIHPSIHPSMHPSIHPCIRPCLSRLNSKKKPLRKWFREIRSMRQAPPRYSWWHHHCRRCKQWSLLDFHLHQNRRLHCKGGGVWTWSLWCA